MGLLYDTYQEALEKLRRTNFRPEDDFSGMDSDFSTSGAGFKASLKNRKEGSPLLKNPIFPTSIFPPGSGSVVVGDKAYKVLPDRVMDTKGIKQSGVQTIFPQGTNVGTSVKVKTDDKGVVTPVTAKNNTPSDPIVMGGMGTQQGDIGFMQKLSNLINVDFDKAAADWKDKGGFEGLLANPAFTLGLAFMQAGAEGKSISQTGLDAVLKAGAISQNYKKIVEARTEVLEVTAADVADMKEELKNYNIFEPNAFEQFFGKAFSLGKKDPQKAYDKAAELFALEYKKEIRAASAAARKKGKDFVVDSATRKRIIEKVIREKKAKVKKNLIPFLKSTVEAPQETYTIPGLAQGGPAQAGKAYLVGEQGPEIMIPHSSGNVIANDDTQVFSMLLAANPQLQKISKDRAMKILKAKFPEYFD
tara:strand:+ start:1686 stop:2936 length:1251 start_codon:yes stop_codon:yes gene_type:complete